MLEMRFHGRGGHGSVMASKMLGVAASIEGKIAQTIPAYLAMRRGGSVNIHVRVSEEPILITSRVYNPDGIVLLDPAWEERKEYSVGLKEGGFAVLNTRKKAEEIDLGVKLSKVGVVDATGLALKFIGRTIPNTAMLGAVCKVTGLVKSAAMEAGIRHELPARLHENNVKVFRAAYDETLLKEM